MEKNGAVWKMEQEGKSWETLAKSLDIDAGYDVIRVDVIAKKKKKKKETF